VGYTRDVAETLVFTVPGMSCAHCVTAVTDEVEQVLGVESVTVDLATKVVEVSGVGMSDDAVRDAILEAGYEVTS
jgi:copper chaperone